jgi:hypothetical protein
MNYSEQEVVQIWSITWKHVFGNRVVWQTNRMYETIRKYAVYINASED